MAIIYCIEDINDLKYVGSTKTTLKHRLSQHKTNKYTNHTGCRSKELNLYYCIIYELETCEEINKKERERYWYEKIDCVNKQVPNRDKKEYVKDTKQSKREYDKMYRLKNKERLRKEKEIYRSLPYVKERQQEYMKIYSKTEKYKNYKKEYYKTHK